MVTRSGLDLLPGTDGADPEVARLLRRLIECSSAHSLGVIADHRTFGPEVVFDVEMGDSHYTLLRRQALSVESTVALSRREREIARLIAKGLPNKSIAAVLDISLWTVATYVRRLFAKLGVSSRAEMVACMMKDGLLEGRG
jgi:DNA-binding CsgD family transcriptional regulator